MCLCLEVVVAVVVVVVGEEPMHLPCADAIAMDSFCGPIMASKTSTHGEEGELLLLPFLSSSPPPPEQSMVDPGLPERAPSAHIADARACQMRLRCAAAAGTWGVLSPGHCFLRFCSFCGGHRALPCQ